MKDVKKNIRNKLNKEMEKMIEGKRRKGRGNQERARLNWSR